MMINMLLLVDGRCRWRLGRSLIDGTEFMGRPRSALAHPRLPCLHLGTSSRREVLPAMPTYLQQLLCLPSPFLIWISMLLSKTPESQCLPDACFFLVCMCKWVYICVRSGSCRCYMRIYKKCSSIGYTCLIKDTFQCRKTPVLLPRWWSVVWNF